MICKIIPIRGFARPESSYDVRRRVARVVMTVFVPQMRYGLRDANVRMTKAVVQRLNHCHCVVPAVGITETSAKE